MWSASFFFCSTRVLHKNFIPVSREPLTPSILNVSSSIEAFLILHPGVSYKEKCRCSSQERWAEVSWFSRTGMDLRNRLLTTIGCFLKKESAGVSWPRVRFCFSLLQDFIKCTSSKSLSCNSIIHHPHGEIFLPASCRNSKACHTEKLKRGVLSAEIISSVS